MTTPFSLKLRMTSVVLGCGSRKELCQRFRAANTATQFDLERSHKWMQGLALPRSPSVYDDLARVIGTARSGAWVAACTPDAFADELCALFGVSRDALDALGGQAGTGPSRRPEDRRHGCFVAYSWAMSSRFEGMLIRGCLTLSPGRGRRLVAAYEEGPPAGPLRFSGGAVENGRTLYLDLDALDDPVIGRFFMVLLQLGRPMDVLCGEFLGAPVLGANPQPTVTPITLLRIDPAMAEKASGPGCYVAAEPAALAADIGGMGLAPTSGLAIAPAMLAFLARTGGALRQTTAEDLGLLADRLVVPAAARSA